MKYCEKCGTELLDEAIFCTNCGAAVGVDRSARIICKDSANTSALKSAAKIFMLIKSAFYGIYTMLMLFLAVVLPSPGFVIFFIAFGGAFALCLSMTVVYFRRVATCWPVSSAFKVCTLLFVSMIAGILMLCDKD